MQAYGNSISAIVFDISKPLDSFENSVTALRHLRSQLFHRGAKALIIGGDFQLELQPSFLDVTGPYALRRPSKHDYWDRHSLLVDLMCTFGLPILSTIRTCRGASVANMVRKLIISWYLRRCKVLVQHPASASLDPITSAFGEHSRSISKFLNVSACKISRDGSHLTKLKQLCTTLEWQMMYLI